MKTLHRINHLSEQVNTAMTATEEGRQTVVDACKELYSLIEEDVNNAGADWMLKGMYSELHTGNFAEPFMCEKKKDSFRTVAHVYETNILKRL